MSHDSLSLDDILQSWFIAKKEISKYEAKIKIYKNQIDKTMNKYNRNTLNGSSFSVVKRTNTRESLNKKSIPLQLFKQYSTITQYNTFHISKNRSLKPKYIK